MSSIVCTRCGNYSARTIWPTDMPRGTQEILCPQCYDALKGEREEAELAAFGGTREEQVLRRAVGSMVEADVELLHGAIDELLRLRREKKLLLLALVVGSEVPK